jgi:hypothetical protein
MGAPTKNSPYASSRHQLVSMFGRQPASHRSTAPFTKFGTGTRDQAMNVSHSRKCAYNVSSTIASCKERLFCTSAHGRQEGGCVIHAQTSWPPRHSRSP